MLRSWHRQQHLLLMLQVLLPPMLWRQHYVLAILHFSTALQRP